MSNARKQSNSQSRLTSFLTRPASIVRKKRLDGLVLNMTVRDFQPFSVVEDAGFREFVAALDPTYILPRRQDLSSDLLPAKYSQAVQQVKTVLTAAEAICLTTDSWTSMCTQNYIAVTAHFVSADWHLESCLLECFQYGERHTADNLRDELMRVVNDWEIREKVVAVVTDNAANITAAVRLTGFKHLPCFAHTLNLVVQQAVHSIEPLKVKVK
jgi:hypothetical protein